MELNLREMQITAHVLGELSPADRQAVQAILDESGQAQRFAEGIRHTAMQLEDELRAERSFSLTEIERLAIEARLRELTPVDRQSDRSDGSANLVTRQRTWQRQRRFSAVVAAAAACLVFTVGVFGLVRGALDYLGGRGNTPTRGWTLGNDNDAPTITIAPDGRTRDDTRHGRSDIDDKADTPPRLRGPVLTWQRDEARRFALLGNSHNLDGRFREPAAIAVAQPFVHVDPAAIDSIEYALTAERMPSSEAVSVEALIALAAYQPDATSDAGTRADIAVIDCPWNRDHKLAITTFDAPLPVREQRKASNLVLLIDVSGSMRGEHRLAAVRRGIRETLPLLTDRDRLSLVVYGGNNGVVLNAASGDQTVAILNALGRIESGGPTNNTTGLALAAKVARDAFLQQADNRLVIVSDGELDALDQPPADQIARQLADIDVDIIDMSGKQPTASLRQLAEALAASIRPAAHTHEVRDILYRNLGASNEALAGDCHAQVQFNGESIGAYRFIGSTFDSDGPFPGSPQPWRRGDQAVAVFEIVPAEEITALQGVGLISKDLGWVYPRKPAAPPHAIEDEAAPVITARLLGRDPGVGEAQQFITIAVAEAKTLAASQPTPRHQRIALAAAFGLTLQKDRAANLSLPKLDTILTSLPSDDAYEFAVLKHLIEQAVRTELKKN